MASLFWGRPQLRIFTRGLPSSCQAHAQLARGNTRAQLDLQFSQLDSGSSTLAEKLGKVGLSVWPFLWRFLGPNCDPLPPAAPRSRRRARQTNTGPAVWTNSCWGPIISHNRFAQFAVQMVGTNSLHSSLRFIRNGPLSFVCLSLPAVCLSRCRSSVCLSPRSFGHNVGSLQSLARQMGLMPIIGPRRRFTHERSGFKLLPLHFGSPEASPSNWLQYKKAHS